MCFPEINVFWRPVLGRVDTNNDTADQCHHGKIKPVRQLQRKPFGRTHNSLKENSHIQQTPSCYLDVKHSRVYMNLTLCFTLTYIFTVFIPCIFDNNSPNICLFTFYFCRFGVCVLCGPQVHAECHHGALLLLLWDWLLRGLRFVGNRFPEGNWLDVITQRLW